MAPKPPVKYPSWFSQHDCRRIDRALAEHGAPSIDLPGSLIIRHEYDSNADAEQAVLAVCLVVVQVLDSHQEYRIVRTLRREAHRMFGDVIAWAETMLPWTGVVRPKLDDSATIIRAVYEKGPWWLTSLMAVSPETVRPSVLDTTKAHPIPVPRSSSSKTPRRQPRGPFTRQADWLAQQLLHAGNLTPNRLEDLGGPDGKTTKKLLQGMGSRRDDVFHKVVQGLNEANRRARRKVVLTIRDIPQD
jgi:hypothetical protein